MSAHSENLYRSAAKEFHADSETNIDEDAIVSTGNDSGAWVAAWIWIPDSEAELCQGDEDEDEKCRVCGENYAPGGDGFDGLCPSCADKAEICSECEEHLTDEEYDGENYDGGDNLCSKCKAEKSLQAGRRRPPMSPLISRAPERKSLRVEIPVLLYVDVDIPPDTNPKDHERIAKDRIWKWLGKPGEEEGISLPDITYLGLSGARLYPSDHENIDSDGRFEIVDVED